MIDNKNEDLVLGTNNELFKQFVPPEGKDFTLLKFLSAEEIAKLPPDIAKYYETKKPKEYHN